MKIATAEKMEVEAEAEKCLIKLGLAERLVSGLSSEGERWGFEIGEMKKKWRYVGRRFVIGRCLCFLHRCVQC